MITQSMVGAIGVLYALELGADILQVNLITTISGAMGIFMMVPFGFLSDRFGRKPMLIIPRIIMLAGTLIQVLATQSDHLILASFIAGFTGGGFWPILASMVTDMVKREKAQEAISTLYLFSSFGMLLGPVLGSYLLTFSEIGLRNIYQLHLVVQAVVLLYMATKIKETHPKEDKGRGSDAVKQVKSLLTRRSFQTLLVIAALFFFYNSIINTYTPILGRQTLGLSDSEISSLSGYRNLAVMIIRFSAATILTRIPVKYMLASTLAIGGVTSLLAAKADGYISLAGTQFLEGISYGGANIMGLTLVAVESVPENRGIANSVYNVFSSMGAITKIVTTPIAEDYGIPSVFILSSITAFLSVIPALVRKDDEKAKA